MASGRKPIKYSEKELERQPLIEIVAGMKGVGKTHNTCIEIDQYVKDIPPKKGRKTLVLNFSDDDMYRKYQAVHPKYVRTLTEKRARQIVPYDDHGHAYTLDKMKKVAEYCIFNFKNGLMVLDDIDKYMVGAHGKSLIGALTTNRHSGMDLIITHQSVSKISQHEWQNAAFLRLHHQLDDVERIQDRVPNYPLVKIGQTIVDRRYFEAVRLFKEEKSISEMEFKKARSFYVHINLLEHKIIGCTAEEFKSASMEFIRHNPQLINKRMKIGDVHGNPLSREAVMKLLFKEYVMYFDGNLK